MNNIIEINNVTKKFKKHVALSDVNIGVQGVQTR